MPECHKCPHNGQGSPFCLKCIGPSDSNHHGRTFVSLDSGHAAQTGAEVEAALKVEQQEPQDDLINLQACCADAVRRLVGFLARIEKADLSLLDWIGQGKSMYSWAKQHGVSRQAASSRYAMLCRKIPALKSVFG
jgi:hypothetical protein